VAQAQAQATPPPAPRLNLIAPLVAPPTSATRAVDATRVAAQDAFSHAQSTLKRAQGSLAAAQLKVSAAERTHTTTSDDMRAALAYRKARSAMKYAVAQVAKAKARVATKAAEANATRVEAATAYIARRPQVTVKRLAKFGREVALRGYSMNPAFYLPEAVNGSADAALGGISLRGGRYGDMAGINIQYGSCVLSYLTPPVVRAASQAQNLTTTVQALRRYGFSNNSAAGLVAALDAVSAMNPANKKIGFGLAGWKNTAALDAAAKSSGSPVTGLSFQLAFLVRAVRADSGTSLLVTSKAAPNDSASSWASALRLPVNPAAKRAKVAQSAWSLADDNKAYSVKPKTVLTCQTTAMTSYASRYENLLGAKTLVGWYDNRTYSVGGMCQKNTQSVWKTVGGTNVNPGINGNAVDVGFNMMAASKLHPWTGYAPRGALVWWDGGIGSGYGHAAVSDGNGNFMNNFGSNSITRTAFARVGAAPMGWADPEIAYGTVEVKVK